MIITNNEKTLRLECQDVTLDEYYDLKNTLENELKYANKLGKNGIGLAAPQIGIAKKMAIIRLPEIKIDLVNAKIIKKYDKNVLIKLSSGEYRLFYKNCICTIGRVSNVQHNEFIIKKAGINRLLGCRPIVRGRAMNPVDHPHGGRTNGGISPRTPWGFLTRGIKTVKNIKSIIVKRRKK
mgnify:CR=1 FL=1